jgi:hypothetical protein
VLHVIEEVVMISNDYKVQGLGVVAISSNAWIIRRMRRNSWRNLLSKIILNLYDETQEVAKAYHAACTWLLLYDSQDKLVYRGQLDDSRPGNGIHVSGNDLRGAIDSIIYNRTMNPNQKPSIGCNIKWK